MLRSLVVSSALLLGFGTAVADVNIAPGAHLTASSWTSQALVVETRDDIPRNAVDGNPATVWRPDAADEGPRWLQLDFTRPWPMRYEWRKLVTHWVVAPTSYRWQVSRDGAHWQNVARRESGAAADVSDATEVAGAGSYLRLVVPVGETPELAEIEVYAGSGGSGTLGEVELNVHGNTASLDWSVGAPRNVFLYRLTRSAALGTGHGAAKVTSIITEGTMLRYTDRVEHPTLEGIAFQYAWTVEAFGPDGRRIDAVATAPREISQRSPNPFALRGVVEGYYGPGYSDAEREDLLRFVGNRGGNFYLYGPKLDPYHRDKWREPYPAAYEESLRKLIAVANDHGVSFAWALSPGLDYDGGAADNRAALEKFKRIQALGVRWFAVFMDDIAVAADVTAATAHVELVNYLQDELRKTAPDTYFIFVPTVYRGTIATLSPAQRRYLETLAGLYADVSVMWTGPDVFAPTIDAADIEPIAAFVGRPVVLWDNYPVADYFFGRRLNLGAVEGRAPDLVAATNPAVAGLLANPMWLPASTRLPLAATLDYLADPQSYAPAKALADQVKREVPPEWERVFGTWLAAFTTFHEVGLDESAATRAVSDAVAALGDAKIPGAPFAEHAAALYVIEPALRRLYHTDLAGELLPAAAAAAAFGEAELWALQTAHLASIGADIAPEIGEKTAAAIAAANAAKWTVTEGGDAEFLEQFFAAPIRWRAASPRLTTTAMPERVAIGQRVRARFAADGAPTTTLIGLPGASLDNGRLEWTPRQTGIERWVVIAANADGANVQFGEIHVTEQEAGTTGGCNSSAGVTPLAFVLFWLALTKFRRFVSGR